MPDKNTEHSKIIEPTILYQRSLADQLSDSLFDLILRAGHFNKHSISLYPKALLIVSDEKYGGRYYTHFELQVDVEQAGGNPVEQTFSLHLSVKEKQRK